MHRMAIASCAGLLLVAGGCAPSPLAERDIEPRPLGRELPGHEPRRQSAGDVPDQPVDSGGLSVEPPSPVETLALNEALRHALLTNPELASFAYDVRAAEAEALQAGLLPNPELEIEIEEALGTGARSGFDAAATEVRLSQPILTAGKRAKRRAVAEFDQDLAAWNYESKRLDVFTETVERFVVVAAAQRRLDVARQIFELSEQVYETVSRQVEAGEVSRVERIRADVQRSSARIERQRADRAMKAARYALARAVGYETPWFERVAGELSDVSAPPELAVLQRALSANPELARWEAELEQRQAAVELARAEAVPNFAITGGIEHSNETDDVAFLGGVSVPLPLFDRNQGNVLAARYEIGRARAQRRATGVRLATELGEAYEQFQAAFEEVQELEQQTRPAAQEAFDLVQTSYRQGGQSLIDVLDAQRTLNEVEAQYVEALAAYHRRAAQIERLIAQPLETAAEASPASPPDEQD